MIVTVIVVVILTYVVIVVVIGIGLGIVVVTLLLLLLLLLLSLLLLSLRVVILAKQICFYCPYWATPAAFAAFSISAMYPASSRSWLLVKILAKGRILTMPA